MYNERSTVSSPPWSDEVLLFCVKVQLTTSTKDPPITLTAPSPPESVKPVSETVESRSTWSRRTVPSPVMTALSLFSEEPVTLRVLPLDTFKVRDDMMSPFQMTVKFAGPSHNRASASLAASDVVDTILSSTVVGHGDERKSGSGSSSSSSSSWRALLHIS